jgi:putative redox protein
LRQVLQRTPRRYSRKHGRTFAEYIVEVTGTRVEDHPVKFIAFHVNHIVRGHNVSEQALADAIELSDTRYGSVAATVRPTATITTSHEIIEIEGIVS